MSFSRLFVHMRVLAVMFALSALLTACGGGGGGTSSGGGGTTGGGGGNVVTVPNNPGPAPSPVWTLLVDTRGIRTRAKLAEPVQALSLEAAPPYRSTTTRAEIVPGAAGSQFNFHAISDGNGGSITVYTTTENGATTGRDIHLVTTNALGQPGTPIVITDEPGDQDLAVCARFPNGNILIAWQNLLNGNAHIYYQLLNSGFLAQLATNGVEVPAPNAININEQIQPQVVLTTFGDVALTTREVGSTIQVLVYLIDSTGTFEWQPDPWQIVAEGDPNYADINLAADDEGGFAVVGQKFVAADDTDVIGERYNNLGVRQWGTVGQPKLLSLEANGTTPAPRRQHRVDLAYINGNFHVPFVDDRAGASQQSPTSGQELSDVVSVVVDEIGNFVSPPEGVTIFTGAGKQDTPAVIANTDGSFTYAADDQGTGGIGSTHTIKVSRRNATLSDINSESALATTTVPPEIRLVPSDEANGAHLVFAGRSNEKAAGRYEYVRPNGSPANPTNGLTFEGQDGAVEGHFAGVQSTNAVLLFSEQRTGPNFTDESRLFLRKQNR